ncbi:hypothetical protein EDC96DRAFT_437054 [Choanephora cucurbitarum]|nr:hypothetical protein EDC96DRAFT_437054 [Choanephora cucurbitarum]
MISNDDNNRSSTIPTDKHKLTKPTRTQSVKRPADQSPHTLKSDSSEPKNIPTQKNSTSTHRRTLSSTSTARLSKQPPMRKSSSLEEKKALSEKIDTKEAAWERLLTVKESYALRVQEKDSEIARLNATLEKTHDAAQQLNDVTKERDIALSRLSILNDTEKELSKTIERLGGHIQCLQQQNSDQANSHETALRSHASQMEQLRKQLIERDQTVTTVERECTDLRMMNAGIISAYESKIAQLAKDNELAIIERELHIDKLQQAVNNFHQIYPASNTSVLMDVEEEADTNTPTPQKQLEYQLELVTHELECEREQVKSMALDIDQLKEEIKRLHRLSATTDSEFYALRGQLEEEILDKRRIMEEANATIENQTKVEEEKESLRITLIKTQFELAETLKKAAINEKHRTKTDEIHWLIEKKRSLEKENETMASSNLKLQDECHQLKDKLILYEQISEKDQNCNTKEHVCQEKIKLLELQIAQEARRYHNLECSKQLKTDALSKEIKELETLIENKVFKESELEGLIEEKEMSIKILNIRLESEEEKNLKQSDDSESISNHGNLEEEVYCEICEEYGHEVITCRAVSIYDVLETKENFITNAQLSAPRSSFYCVNCDVFGEHPSEDCPNQDETF